MNSIHGSQDKQPNMVLVKQEIESDDVLFPLEKEEVHTLKLETMSTENKLESPSGNTLEAKISSNGSLELKSETLDRDCDVESAANASIKYEMVDIKSEDKTIQESHLDDKYNSGNRMTKPTKMSSKVKPYKCDICDYSCARKGTLKTHLRVHTGEKPFKCNICSYSCTQSGSVKIHLRSHTGEKPSKCNICDFRCRDNGHLKSHLSTHTGIKPFKCDICHYYTATNSDLKKHLRIHTGEKPFKCNICDYCCAESSSLKKHLRTHTGEKPFKCNICDYCGANHSNLKRHLRTHTQQ